MDNNKALSKLEDLLSDIRISPEVIGEYLTQSPLEIQERAFLLAISYLKSLSAQHLAGSYINANFEIAHKANKIREGYGLGE